MAEQNDENSPAPLPAGMQFSNLLQRAVPAETNRRSFIPVSGSTFNDTQNNIRIPLSVPLHTFVDLKNSYLQYTLTVKTTTNPVTATTVAAISDTIDFSGASTINNNDKLFTVSTTFYNEVLDGYVVKYDKGASGTPPTGLVDGKYYIVVKRAAPNMSLIDFETGKEKYYKFHEDGDTTNLVPTAKGSAAGSAHSLTLAPAAFQKIIDPRLTMPQRDVYPGVIVDGGATSLIESAQIQGPDGSILEDCRNLNIASDILRVMTHDKEYSESYGALTSGIPSNSKDTAARLRFVADGTGGKASMTLTCQLPLAYMQQKTYAPLGFVSGAPVTLSLTLAPITQCLKSLGTTAGLSYEVSNVKYMAQTIRFDSSVTSTFQSLMESVGAVQAHGVTPFHTSNLNLASGSSSVQTITIPARVRSLRCLLTAIYDGASNTNQAAFSITNRVTRKISQYSASIGGVKYPVSPVLISGENQGEAISEVLKCSSFVNNKHTAGMLRKSLGVPSAEIGTPEADAYYPQGGEDRFCSFFIAQPFMNYSGDSAEHENGLNLSSQTSNIQNELQMTVDATTQVHTFALCDIIFTYLSSGVIAASI